MITPQIVDKASIPVAATYRHGRRPYWKPLILSLPEGKALRFDHEDRHILEKKRNSLLGHINKSNPKISTSITFDNEIYSLYVWRRDDEENK